MEYNEAAWNMLPRKPGSTALWLDMRDCLCNNTMAREIPTAQSEGYEAGKIAMVQTSKVNELVEWRKKMCMLHGYLRGTAEYALFRLGFGEAIREIVVA